MLLRLFSGVLAFGIFLITSALLYDRWQMRDDFSQLAPIDPLPHAQELVAKNRFAEAERYLDYFVEHNSTAITPQDKALLKTIHEKRQSWGYKAKAIMQGALTGKGEEWEGMIGAGVADLFVVGDIRDLIVQGSHWVEGEKVDDVIVALSSLGVAATAATITTAGGAGGIKGSLSLLKNMRKGRLLPPWFLRALARLPQTADTKKAANTLLEPIADLYRSSGFLGTRAILARSKSLDDLEKMRFFAKRFGKESAVLMHIDPDAVRLAEHFPARTVTRASLYGKAGFKTLARRLKYTTRVSKYVSKHWQTLLRSIPLWALWLTWGLSGLWWIRALVRRITRQ